MESKYEKIDEGASPDKSSRRPGVIALLDQVSTLRHRRQVKTKPYATRITRVTLPGVGPKRLNFEEENTQKKAGPVREMRIFRDTESIKIREAITAAALTSGPWSQRTKVAINMNTIDNLEGRRFNYRDSEAVCQTAIRIASRALVAARKFLPLGAYNNREVERRPIGWALYPAWQNALNEVLASKIVLQTGRRDPENFVAWLSAFGHAARTTGGGVCTYISALTCGILTTIAPPETEILLVYSKADHQFCVISHQKSPWYTVDPWTLNCYVMKWKYSYFAPTDEAGGGTVDNYFKVTINHPLKEPYGITYDDMMIKQLLAISKGELGVKSRGEMAHQFGQCCNAVNPRGCCGGDGSQSIRGMPAVQTHLDWG